MRVKEAAEQKLEVARDRAMGFGHGVISAASVLAAFQDAGLIPPPPPLPPITKVTIVDVTVPVDVQSAITALEALKTPIKKAELEPVIGNLKAVLDKLGS